MIGKPIKRTGAWRAGAVGLLFVAACCASARADISGAAAFARQDYARSAGIFLREAEQGRPEAQTYLGFMYAHGRGVPQNYAVAVGWLRCAALQGYPAAQFLLGLMIDKGQGVRQDFVEAEFWLNLAAAHASRHDRDYWTRIRDAVAGKLTLDEIALVQRRAVEWTPIQ